MTRKKQKAVKAWAWVRCWWHCLTHMHRMSHAEVTDYGMHDHYETVWIGCGDCQAEFYTITGAK